LVSVLAPAGLVGLDAFPELDAIEERAALAARDVLVAPVAPVVRAVLVALAAPAVPGASVAQDVLAELTA
jgi:hypothetical protein